MAVSKTVTAKGPQYKLSDSRGNAILVTTTPGPIRTTTLTATDGISAPTIYPEHAHDLVQLLLLLNQGVLP